SSRTLTYDGLYRLSNRWGRHLRALGARPNTLVAVVMEKGWEQPVAVLGTLQAGAAYLPVDAGLPKERLWYLLQHGQVELVLTQSWLEQRLDWPPGVTRLCVDREPPAEVDDGPLTAVQQPDDLACCIFTSGSTGLPKGVMITHRGVLNAILDTNRAFAVGPADRVLALTALHHDMSFYDLFGMLAAGGTLVIPDAAGRRDPAHWSELMRRERVTLWNSVPATMDMLLEYAAGRQEQGPAQSAVLPECLRLAFLGGDWIPRSIPHRLGTQVPAARVVSVGGPTETTLWNIWYPVEAVDPQWKSIPYGRPIANSRYYVLYDAMADCPDWVPGELYCAGTGLARGYWRDEARTQAKFVVHPATGESLCRTGDLGRYRPDGTIEFVGRADFQVKIQGQRIELGEIEATLQRHHAVRTAVVMAVGEAQGKKRLVAYVVPREGATATSDELRPFLLGKLAEHMVPSAFVILDRLPLSGNGKVDRLALAKLAPRDAAGASASGAAAGADVAGGTPSVVERIGRIVAEVLELDRPDPAANLLSLGANSLDMVRIGNRLEAEFGARPRLDEIFRLQTVAALAGYYDRRGQAASPGDAQGQVAARAKPLNGTVNGLLHGAGVGAAGPMGVQALLAGYRVLLDPAEREAWKKSQPGIRRDDPGRPGVQLPRPVLDEALRRQYTERRSQRQFSPRPIPFESFGTFLSCLMQLTLEQGPKYRYASPGGLYPTQVYLHVKPGRVEGVPAGTYYYHPVEHRLVSLHPGAQLDRSIHVPFINTPIFDQAAFSLFLVAELEAIAPGYGEQSMRFATLEAGIMAHLLETAAPRAGLGLCQVGSVEFERIRQHFDLRQSHVLIHSLLGGLAPSAAEQGTAAGGAGAPLSFSQRRLWFTDQLAAGSARRSPNSNPNAWRIDGPLVVEALERSFDAVRRRHEILRTTVSIEGGEPVQVVAPPSPFELPLVDLRHLPPEVREAEV
ncbi:MAG TPA: amino acid adenylation domain-containing protein, partial [Chloroflexota bacterium]|nr:amino acid adenylation domain-containing protein [Chloroflexota bacterium]